MCWCMHMYVVTVANETRCFQINVFIYINAHTHYIIKFNKNEVNV